MVNYLGTGLANIGCAGQDALIAHQVKGSLEEVFSGLTHVNGQWATSARAFGWAAPFSLFLFGHSVTVPSKMYCYKCTDYSIQLTEVNPQAKIVSVPLTAYGRFRILFTLLEVNARHSSSIGRAPYL